MENNMIQGSIGKNLVRFTMPLILSGLFQQIFNWVDAFIVANVALDMVFVAVLGYGAAGAAAATVLSQMAMTIFIMIYTVEKYPILRFHFDRDMIRRTVIAEGMKFSMPPALQSGTSSVGNLVLQRFMNGFGEQTVAAITTAYRIDTVIILPIVNFGSGIATVTAQNIGAGNRERARKVLKTGAVMIALVSLCLTALILTTGESLIAMFGLAGIAALGVRIAASYALAGLFGRRVIAYAEAIAWMFLLGIYFVRFLYKSR